jgi:hypothetical protein
MVATDDPLLLHTPHPFGNCRCRHPDRLADLAVGAPGILLKQLKDLPTDRIEVSFHLKISW